VSRSRLRASDLRAPFHGVRTLAGAPDDECEASVLRRVGEYAARMPPTQFFCLVPACVLWTAPLPPSAFFTLADDGAWKDRPLDVGVILPARAPRCDGVRGRSVNPGWAEVVEHPLSSLPVTSPASTWAMMGQFLGDEDLIALGDAMVREPMHPDDPPALTGLAALDRAIAVGRRPGIPRLREALPFIRTRSRSRQETRLRLALTRDARLREPSLNWPVHIDEVMVAQIDVAYPRLRLGFEYEGEQHLTDAAQWAKDIRRYEMLADLGWRIIRVTKSDLDAQRPDFVRRARAAFAAATHRVGA
jgi:very-short-patch-repair endonuclease